MSDSPFINGTDLDKALENNPNADAIRAALANAEAAMAQAKTTQTASPSMPGAAMNQVAGMAGGVLHQGVKAVGMVGMDKAIDAAGKALHVPNVVVDIATDVLRRMIR